MLSSSVIIHFAFLGVVHHSHGIEPLSRYIAPTDILNKVLNQIFSSLQFKTHSESKIKEYSKMHKYFVSFARLHKNDWKELLKATSLDIKIDNGTGDYTAIINEVLNEDNKTEAVNDMLNEENVKKHIEDFLGTLENVKELYLRNNSFITVNYEILHRFHRNHHSLRNKTVDRLNFAQNDSDFWVPDGRRIYQGKRTTIKHFPFVASVHIFDQFTCAGSIIHADLVITAASCLQLAHNNRFYRENPAFLSVRIGSSTYASGDRVPVLEVYFYPSYEPKTLKNNLAILRLQRLIKFHKKNKNVKKIRVDTNAWALPSNTDGITIIGWGARKKSNKIYNPWKNKLAMDVLYFYGLADCRDVYSKALVTKKNFCAGFISRGGGACNRDVGAPGVVNGILTGVVSFGSPNCGERDSPTVFTKLGYYIDWIEDIMAQDPPKQSVRITTRRPHVLHTIMSTRPLHESNFLIEPIDLSKVPDIRDLDVRMPQDNNEFINGEFNSVQSVSTQTFSTSKQIIQQNPKDPDKFVDITRLRDENENKGSPNTTYEKPQLNHIYTVMGNFDEDVIFPSSNDRFDEKSTMADLLARTRAQNKELKDAKPQWQIDLELSQKSENFEDDTKEFVISHYFESNTTPLNVIDKRFETNNTDAEKLLLSDDYDDDSETVVVQQSLPIHPISKEKVFSIKTPENAIVKEENSGVSLKVKQPLKSLKEQDLDKEIEKFIENLDFEEILLSEEELKTQVLTDTEFPEQRKNQKVTPVPVNHKRYSLQDQKTKPALKNGDLFPLRDFTPKRDHVFPLQDQKTKQATNKYYLNQKQDQKKNTELLPENYHTFPIQIEKIEQAQTNDYVYPQDQQVKPSPKNNHMFPLQRQKIKPTPKKNHLNSKQAQKTKPAEKYNPVPLQDEETKSAQRNDYLFPSQDRKTKPPPKKYFTAPLQDEETKSAQENYDTFPLRDSEPKNDYIFPHQGQKVQPAPANYRVLPQNDQKTKRPKNNYNTFSLQDEETESEPTNDYMNLHRDQKAEPAPTNDHKLPQQNQKKKARPKNDFTFPLQDEETEPAPTNDYIYAQQDQETELASKNDDKKTKTQPKKYYTIPLQYEEIKPEQTNDDEFPTQTLNAKAHNVLPPLLDQKAKPSQINSDVPLQKQDSALKGDDILTFLYLSDNERKPDDSSQEFRHLQKNGSEILPLSLVFDVIAEELRKKERKTYTHVE